MRSNRNDAPPADAGSRREAGWVLIGTLVVAAVAASLTVGWARHAVLAKGKLEMATGASRTEEACRSGFDRCRAKMRNGYGPGSEEDGEEDVVVTEDGDEVVVSRQVGADDGDDSDGVGESDADEYDVRQVRVRANHESGNDHKDASLKGRARIVPGSQSKGRRTRLTCEAGGKALLIPGLTMVTGQLVFTPSSNVSGVYLLEDGAHVILEDNEFTGCFITRASLCEDNALASGSSRPKVELRGGCKLKEGGDFPGLSMCGPDLVVEADEDARLEIDGMVVAEDVDLPCRGTLRGMLVVEGNETLSSKLSRPGNGRGAPQYPNSVMPGSEKMTRLAFPTDNVTDAEYDAIEGYDVTSMF